jgi:hypothetical protein
MTRIVKAMRPECIAKGIGPSIRVTVKDKDA